MIGAAAAYMAGLFFASFFTAPALLLCLSVIIVSALLLGRHYDFKATDYVVMGASFTAAICAFTAYTAMRYDPAVEMNGKTASFSGEVVEAVHYDGGSSSYILKGRINGDISAKVSFYSSSVEADYGDVITIGSCTMSVPPNDYLFDSKHYYRSEGVFLTANNAKGVSLEKTGGRCLKSYIVEYRDKIISDFRTSLESDSGDLLAGMVFGEKRGMDLNVKTAVYRSGIGHMLAVSGLHVSVAILVLMTLLKYLRVNKYVSFAAMELILIFLTAMANYPVSAIRAAIMMNFMYAAKLFRRQNDTFTSLAGAVLLICLFQPYSVYDEGFILSVAGTFGIGVFAQYMTKDMPCDTVFQKFICKCAVMLCTTLCVFPLSLLYFDETSLISPLTNVFIVPLCSVSMVIGLIYALSGGIFDLLPVAKLINDFILRISDILAHVRYTHFSCDSKVIVYGALICVFMTVLSAAIFRNRKIIMVYITASLIFVFIGSGIEISDKHEKLTVAVLGKGNNAAVVVSYGGSADVIDISGHYRSAAYVRKYLTRNNISEVDNAVITHKVQSAYASYENELEFVDVASWIVCGDTDIAGMPPDYDVSYCDNGFSAEKGEVYFKYYDNALTVGNEYGRIVFVKSTAEDHMENELTVCYGKPSKNEDKTAENVIYLDDCNNFEIILSEKGRCEIRRL